MTRLALIAATAGSLALSAVAAPAEARGGFGPGLAGDLIAGAVIGGIASNAYGYGPGYGYYGGVTARATMAAMPRSTMVNTPPTMAMATAIGGSIVRPMLTMLGRDITAAGTEVGVTAGKPA